LSSRRRSARGSWRVLSIVPSDISITIAKAVNGSIAREPRIAFTLSTRSTRDKGGLLRISIAQVISSARSWLITVGVSIVIPRDSSWRKTIAWIVNGSSSKKSSITVASVVSSTIYIVVVVRDRHAQVLSSWQALSRSETVRNTVAVVCNNVRACTVAWAGGGAITRERINALASSIDAGSIRISSAEWDAISVALARSSWRRCSGVGDGNVGLLAWRRVSNISSVYVHLHKVVVEAGSCIVVLNEIQRSSNSKDSVHFGSNINGKRVFLQVSSGWHLLRVQRRTYSRWLVIVACSRNRIGINGTGYKIRRTLCVDGSFIESGGSNSGSSRNAR